MRIRISCLRKCPENYFRFIRFRFKLNVIPISLLFFFITNSCKKDEPSLPILETVAVTGITQTTAISGGNIIDYGGASLMSAGICWSTREDPTISDSRTIDSAVVGLYTSLLTALTPNTVYYIRAYATNIAGTSYGNQVSFTTSQIRIRLSKITDNTSGTAYFEYDSIGLLVKIIFSKEYLKIEYNSDKQPIRCSYFDNDYLIGNPPRVWNINWNKDGFDLEYYLTTIHWIFNPAKQIQQVIYNEGTASLTWIDSCKLIENFTSTSHSPSQESESIYTFGIENNQYKGLNIALLFFMPTSWIFEFEYQNNYCLVSKSMDIKDINLKIGPYPYRKIYNYTFNEYNYPIKVDLELTDYFGTVTHYFQYYEYQLY